MIRAIACLVASVVAGLATTGAALAAPEPVLSATYVATIPPSLGAGSSSMLAVTVTNTGDETWAASGPNPVNLAYHWYDGSGAVVVWDGARTPLGAVVPPGGSAAANATLIAPAKPGPYQLRLALVREGQAWFPPGPAAPVTLVPAYQATIGAVAPPAMLVATAYTVSVTLTNTGTAAWSAGGANPVRVAYHWHDTSGNTVVWDGARTGLGADVAAGASVAVAAQITAPPLSGRYRLTVDLVREGVGWFESMGSSPSRTSIAVQTATYRVGYGSPGAVTATIGEQKSVALSLTNTGNVTWNAAGPNPISVAYHLNDAAGNTVVWDGARTAIGGDLAPGASRTVTVAYTAPSSIGSYALLIDVVREGVAWLSQTGSPPSRFPLAVTSGYASGYGASTTPSLATIGATLQLSVDVVNYGPRTLSAGGSNPVALSYHVLTPGGATVTWEGRRGVLPRDLRPGDTATVRIDVALPQATGDYHIQWDLVQEGVAWFSQLGVQSKVEPITVQPGVTFYGRGFGHGIGMSQWGAQGWATGAFGPALSAEQIVAKYYPGTQVAALPPPGGGVRVLLSQPSSSSRYTCGAAFFNGSLMNAMSNGGFRVLDEGQGNRLVATAAGTVTFQVFATNGVVQVFNQATVAPTKVYEGAGPVTIVPVDATKPIRLQEKGWYRGNVRFTNLGNTLRVTNFVSYDDYVRGVVPMEMLQNWSIAAYKAQAYASRSYAYTSYRGGASDYDVQDDQSDQCYGGVQLADSAGGRPVEGDATNAAVSATAGRVVAYAGAAIRAYFSSSSGGYTLPFGCWGATKTTCADSPPYLVAVADPADPVVSVPTANKQAGWTATYTSAQIRSVLLGYRGLDIGTLTSVDLSNQAPNGLGHVVSIRFTGTAVSVEVPAEGFLRGQLGLKSTMVRLSPF